MDLKRFAIDASAASVSFTASSSVHPIRSVGSATGWIEARLKDHEFVGAKDLAGYLEVPLDGLSSGNPLIDREMKRRVDTGPYPVISAGFEEAIRVERDRVTITGTIDFLGVSTLVEGEITIEPGPRLVGTGEVDVRWWGLEPPRLLVLRVEPIVTVEIDLPLIEER